jgi:hypothetical protein
MMKWKTDACNISYHQIHWNLLAKLDKVARNGMGLDDNAIPTVAAHAV